MKKRYDLAHLERDYIRRLNRFENIFLDILTRPKPSQKDKYEINYLTIELLNSYRNFNRAFCFSCITGARTKNNTLVGVAGVSDEFDFINAVFSTYNKKTVDVSTRTWDSRAEPAWEADVLRIASVLNLQNEVSVTNAFSISSFYKDLKVFRNFCGHRSHALFEEVVKTSIQFNINEKTIEKILTTQTPSNIYLMMEWIKNCRYYASEICK